MNKATKKMPRGNSHSKATLPSASCAEKELQERIEYARRACLLNSDFLQGKEPGSSVPELVETWLASRRKLSLAVGAYRTLLAGDNISGEEQHRAAQLLATARTEEEAALSKLEVRKGIPLVPEELLLHIYGHRAEENALNTVGMKMSGNFVPMLPVFSERAEASAKGGSA